MELLYKDYGKSLRKQQKILPPQDDIIIFDPKVHQEFLESNLKWGECPTKHQPRILSLIKKYWDVLLQKVFVAIFVDTNAALTQEMSPQFATKFLDMVHMKQEL